MKSSHSLSFSLSAHQPLLCACLCVCTFTGAGVGAANAQQASGVSTPAVPAPPASTAPAPAKPSAPAVSPQVPSDDTDESRYDAKWQAEHNALFAEATKHTGEARAYLAAGRLPEAEQACFAAFAAAPVIGPGGLRDDVPFADMLLGEVYLRMGQNAKSIYWFQHAIAQGTSGSSMLPQLALAYVRNGQDDQALLVYSDRNFFKSEDWSDSDRPGTKNPDQLEATILLTLGGLAQPVSRVDALNDYEAAAKLVPHNALVALSCGSTLLDLKRYDEAETYFKTASKYGSSKVRSFADSYTRRLKGERQTQADALKAKASASANKTPK